MANRITIYGKTGEPATETLRREMRSMSLDYDFHDIAKTPRVVDRLRGLLGEDAESFPKVEVVRADNPGSVFLSNPDLGTLRQTLYAEEVLGITSFWI
jgi:hypothetical protein